MFTRSLGFILCILLFNLFMAPDALASETLRESKQTKKIRTKIIKLGTGPDAKIELKLKDGSKIKGYVSETREDKFLVTNPVTGEITPVTYPQVKQAKGNNLSTGAFIAIGLGVLVLVIILAAQALD